MPPHTVEPRGRGVDATSESENLPPPLRPQLPYALVLSVVVERLVVLRQDGAVELRN